MFSNKHDPVRGLEAQEMMFSIDTKPKIPAQAATDGGIAPSYKSTDHLSSSKEKSSGREWGGKKFHLYFYTTEEPKNVVG
jgi:hypothetical protein